jgi:hypothetical protein
VPSPSATSKEAPGSTFMRVSWGAPHAFDLAESGDQIRAGRDDDPAEADGVDLKGAASRWPVRRSRSVPRPATQRSWLASD